MYGGGTKIFRNREASASRRLLMYYSYQSVTRQVSVVAWVSASLRVRYGRFHCIDLEIRYKSGIFGIHSNIRVTNLRSDAFNFRTPFCSAYKATREKVYVVRLINIYVVTGIWYSQ